MHSLSRGASGLRPPAWDERGDTLYSWWVRHFSLILSFGMRECAGGTPLLLTLSLGHVLGKDAEHGQRRADTAAKSTPLAVGCCTCSAAAAAVVVERTCVAGVVGSAWVTRTSTYA